MRHFVMTRSAFGPAWDLDANRRRLEITRAVTARLLSLQTVSNWTLVVLLDPRDPLQGERLGLYVGSAPTVIVLWRDIDAPTEPSKAAAADYRAPWRSVVGDRDQVLMTRLDDDDGLAPDALARYQRAARRVRGRAALMLPFGIRVWNGCYATVRHQTNAMHTLVTPEGDGMAVYDYGHTKVARVVRVVTVDPMPGWLWVRHRDTLSDWRLARRPITATIRRAFPVDWPALEAAWRS